MPRRSTPPEMRAFILEIGRRRGLDYDQIAELVRDRFGSKNVPNGGQIATLLGQTYGGRSTLDRLQRDHELAEWLRARKNDGRVADIRSAAIARFGAARVPSQTTLAAFLRHAGRRGRYNGSRQLSRDPELTAWLLAEAASKSVPALRAACLERFGSARTPSRSGLWRMVKAIAPGRRVRPLKAAIDTEIADWLRTNVRQSTLRELTDRCAETFGPERAPSLMSIHRYLVRLPAKLTRRKCNLDRDPELAAWVWDHRSGQTLDALSRQIRATFGSRVPSRSSLHRYLSAIRRGLVQRPDPSHRGLREI